MTMQKSNTTYKHSLAGLFLGLLAFNNAEAYQNFSFDPSQIGLTGSAFTANAFTAAEVSHISFLNPDGDWAEDGYAYLTGYIKPDGTQVSLPSDYTLYVHFQGTGNQNLGVFYTATETLYAVNGQSTFGIDPGTHDATVDNHGNSTIELATSHLIWGISGVNGADFWAKLLATFSPTVSGSNAFSWNDPAPHLFYGDFYHAYNEVIPGGEPAIEFIMGANGPIGVNLRGGFDVLGFVPEPFSLLLFLGGLPALLGFSRKSV